MNLNQAIFNKINDLGITEKLKEHYYLKMECVGLMDLHGDKLRHENGTTLISLAHNGIQNGDVMADPDMEVVIDENIQEAYANRFQNDYVGIVTVNNTPENERSMNEFLVTWLDNIKKSNYQFTKIE